MIDNGFNLCKDGKEWDNICQSVFLGGVPNGIDSKI